jgi:general secretion pathway protein N
MGSSLVLIGLFVLALFVSCDASAQVLTAPLVADQLRNMPAPKPKSATAGLTASSATSTAESVLSANPLWAIPLASLTATRERPLFSPSRRPPPPVVVAKAPAPPPPPPKPAEPEKPQLLLVGTILGADGQRIGLFVAPGRNGLRLKLGEDDKGWVLRAVRPRQVVLEKGQQSAVLELPQRDVSTRGLPPSPPSQAPAVPTNVDKPPVPTSSSPSPPPALPPPLVNPFAVNQIETVLTPPPPSVNPFAPSPIQKARLR